MTWAQIENWRHHGFPWARDDTQLRAKRSSVFGYDRGWHWNHTDVPDHPHRTVQSCARLPKIDSVAAPCHCLKPLFHRRCLCMRDALTVWRCRSFPKQEDKTKLKLLYANRTPADTVLLSELRELQHSHPEQLEVRYLVEQLEGVRQHDVSLAGSSVRTEADFAVGRPCAEAIRGFLPSPFEAQTAVLVCGPEGMMDALCGVGVNRLQGGEVPRLGGLLRSMGYGRQVVQFSDTSVA